ncbi:hypothetical protein LTS18_005193 [Coniosporium uncinatum]|uniref:Uncharacterized protein n=1 Tax=Coniosporium uncinatum TaxID=93489 RepID=A0ACC3D4X6_9PEZI|nr:hypothetical protein LTS18_005193 [Coniosporium uncinatum]
MGFDGEGNAEFRDHTYNAACRRDPDVSLACTTCPKSDDMPFGPLYALYEDERGQLPAGWERAWDVRRQKWCYTRVQSGLTIYTRPIGPTLEDMGSVDADEEPEWDRDFVTSIEELQWF